jgi:type II secretory pathway component PulJ
MSLAHKNFGKRNHGFTLMEALAATAILTFVASSVWVVIDRCVTSTANSKIKMQAFEVARENLETILAQESVTEIVENGNSERYPGIEWETIIETFYEPINSQMWLRAVCTAVYYDTNGQQQSIELEHWLTGLSKDQLLQTLMDEGDNMEDLSSLLIETIEDAAEYAGVDTETIEEWLKKGMKTTEDDYFVTTNLELFKRNNGSPSDEDIENLQIASEEDLARLKMQQTKQEMLNEIEPTTGMTYGEMEQMDIKEIWEVLKKSREGN